MNSLPLEGIRVADFSWVIVGPYSTQWLAMMGAEVIRIESTLRMDILRRQPPFADGVQGADRSGLFNGLNMSKKSCTLDLRRPEAIELARRLIKVSDVVVEQFSYGMMDRFGLSFESLRQLKPDLVLVSVSGMGRTGPLRELSGYNESFLAYSGLATITGYEVGPPVLSGGVWADHATGMNLTLAILTALYRRSQTGLGQTVDISMLESVAAQIPEAIIDYAMNGRATSRTGNHDRDMAPHSCYPCAGDDQWVAISVRNDEEWRAFCGAIGNPRWACDPKYATAQGRLQHQDELDRLVSEWTRKREKRWVAEMLQRAGVPAGPTLNVEEVVHDPQLNHRGFFVNPEHPEIGRRLALGMPWIMSESEGTIGSAPTIGQDNAYVFGELLGLSDEEFARLVGEGVIR